MLKYNVLILFAVSGLLLSCAGGAPPVADFTLSVTGVAPNATVAIVNSSTGEEVVYRWNFSEGAGVESSDQESPDELAVDKAGVFTVTLLVSNEDGESELSRTLDIGGHGALHSFTDLEFGFSGVSGDYGRFFSIETGLVYKESEVNAENGSKIDLAFDGVPPGFYYFERPRDSSVEIPDASYPKIYNYEVPPSISMDSFEAMQDDALLSPLTIEHKMDSFGEVPWMVLFQTEAGNKGVILVSDEDKQRVLVDIKVQKYLDASVEG